jgi:hypothetical protein
LTRCARIVIFAISMPHHSGQYVSVTSMPTQARLDKGEEIEKAFKILLYMAVPVFAMAVASSMRLLPGAARGDGAQPVRAAPMAWFRGTSASPFS